MFGKIFSSKSKVWPERIRLRSRLVQKSPNATFHINYQVEAEITQEPQD